MPDRFYYVLETERGFLTTSGFRKSVENIPYDKMPYSSDGRNYLLVLNSDSIGVSTESKDDIVSAFFSCVPSSRLHASQCKVYVYKCPLKMAPLDGRCVHCAKKGICGTDKEERKPFKIL